MTVEDWRVERVASASVDVKVAPRYSVTLPLIMVVVPPHKATTSLTTSDCVVAGLVSLVLVVRISCVVHPFVVELFGSVAFGVVVGIEMLTVSGGSVNGNWASHEERSDNIAGSS